MKLQVNRGVIGEIYKLAAKLVALKRSIPLSLSELLALEPENVSARAFTHRL